MRVEPIATNIQWKPKTRLRMLFAQPNVVLNSTGTGYVHTTTTADRQATTIKAILDLCVVSDFQCVVLPEFSLPIGMLADVTQALSKPEWPKNSIVISGVETAAPAEFAKLLQGSNNPNPVRELNFAKSTFVNFCTIWIKDSGGVVRVFYQPKLKPSKPEQATQGMYEGDYVLLFATDRLNLAAVICFDCIAIEGGVSTMEGVLCGICALAPASPVRTSMNLDLLFVPQHNARAEHPEFIGCAEKVLTPRDGLNNANCAIAFVNSAHKDHGRAIEEDYGRSGLYYKQGSAWRGCKPNGPLTLIPQTFALEDIPNTLVRARFREDGPSLHEFEYLIPTAVGPDAGENRYPLLNAIRHKISADGTLETATPIPALKKVVFDWLPPACPVKDTRFQAAHVQAVIAQGYERTRAHLSQIELQRLEEITNVLFCSGIDPKLPASINPDTWQASQKWWDDASGQAFVELLSVLVLLGAARTVQLDAASRIRTGTCDHGNITVLSGGRQYDWNKVYTRYLHFLQHEPCIDLVGGMTFIVFTQVTSDPTSFDKVNVPEFFGISQADSEELPLAIRPAAEDMTTVRTEFSLISATALRSGLLRQDAAALVEFVEAVLGN
jgi:hypothetical protein